MQLSVLLRYILLEFFHLFSQSIFTLPQLLSLFLQSFNSPSLFLLLFGPVLLIHTVFHILFLQLHAVILQILCLKSVVFHFLVKFR